MANTQEKRIQIIFRVDTLKGIYQDALWFSEEEYNNTTQEEIEVKKQERINKWVNVVSTPIPELSKEEKITQVQSEIDMLTSRITELQSRRDKING